MATATRSTRSTGKSDAKPTCARAPRSPRRSPPQEGGDEAAPKRAEVTREQDSVTGHDAARQARPHDPRDPAARAEVGRRRPVRGDRRQRGFSPVYLSQSDDALLGKPQKIRVTIKALA